MALISVNFTFTVGAVIVASQHNSNFSTVYNCVNGNLDTTNLSASAGIVDTQLAAISTAGKVSGSALTALSGTPAGAGLLPIVNIATGTPTGSKFVRDDGTLVVPATSLGSWVSKTADGTVYQATTDGFSICWTNTNGASQIKLDGYSDSSNPPTTQRATFWTQGATIGGGTVFFPVKKNDYYKITGGGVMFFISLGV